ncbi:MAG TPA: LrgB family protein [Candidatus Limnocylindrales bacterium]|nr:LrgB family protein [Candidatus Limnocylindrales bacterium]
MTTLHGFVDSLVLVTLTIALYAVGVWLYQRLGRIGALQPVLIAIFFVVLGLKLTGFSYDRYWAGTKALHFLLGPAIVALAVPLYENLQKERRVMWPVLGTLLAGGVWVTGSALLLGVIFRLDHLMLISLTTKSVTVPIALAIAEKIGGVAPLTVISVFTTGITGIICTPAFLRWARVTDPAVSGFTLGLTSHAFGVVRALELGSEAVAFASLGMVLMGCASAVIVPAIFRLL